MNIVWRLDYDLHSDKCYKTPCCDKCSDRYGAVPVYLNEDGLCECVNCHQTATPDKKTLKWLQDREGVKIIENDYCLSCGKNTY